MISNNTNKAPSSSTLTPFLITLTLVLSLPLLFLFIPYIFPPRQHNHLQFSLSDELDDLALFRRATLDSISNSRASSIPSKAKPKIAFLFLTNSNLHFAPLWERFFGGRNNNTKLYNVYVHADPTCHISDPGGVFENRFIAAKKTERASPSLVAAERRLIATALLDDPLNYYFTIVSQSCVPLHSFRFVYDSVFGSSEKRRSFIEMLSNEPQMWDR